MTIIKKPFDLDRARAGAKIIRRDGVAVRFVAYVPEASEPYRVVVITPGGSTVDSYYENGSYGGQYESACDLFMVYETKREVRYANLYADGTGAHFESLTLAHCHHNLRSPTASKPFALSAPVTVEIQREVRV